jgi:hypothetical protein
MAWHISGEIFSHICSRFRRHWVGYPRIFRRRLFSHFLLFLIPPQALARRGGRICLYLPACTTAGGIFFHDMGWHGWHGTGFFWDGILLGHGLLAGK